VIFLDVIILIERRSISHFARFIELFRQRQEIPIREVRSKIAKSTFYYLVLNKIYCINQVIKSISQDTDFFINVTLKQENGKIIQTLRRHENVQIIGQDSNFFHIKVSGYRAK
jgi:hypothetical protein